jgi:hypothetical protein
MGMKLSRTGVLQETVQNEVNETIARQMLAGEYQATVLIAVVGSSQTRGSGLCTLLKMQRI